MNVEELKNRLLILRSVKSESKNPLPVDLRGPLLYIFVPHCILECLFLLYFLYKSQ